MPSAHGPHHFIMERQKTMNNVSSTQYGGDPCTFICTECGEGFTHYPQVLAHMTSHGPLESFSFDGSSNGFEVPREYVLQENGTLAILNGFSVSLFPVKPPSPGVLPTSTPISKSLSPEPRPRSIPEANNQKPLDLESARKKRPEVDYRCEICCKSFNSLKSLHCHHQYRNLEQNYRCTLCCKIFEGRQALETHLQGHARERFLSCAYCGKRFIKAFALVAHQKESHTTSTTENSETNDENKLPKMYSCRKCNLNFFWMSDFQTHAQHHCTGKASNATFAPKYVAKSKDHNDRLLQNCYSNGNITELKNDVEMNHKTTSNNIDTTPVTTYRCGLCGDCFPNLTTLKEHQPIHQLNQEILPQKPRKARRRRAMSTNGKLYSCKLCQCVFNHSSSLSRHMRYHKGTMHKCTFCGRHFSQRCDLTRHLNMNHAAELQNKPGFKHLIFRAQRHNLINKQTAPEIDRNGKRTKRAGRVNYKCQECGKRFGLAYVYKRHLRHHKRFHNKCPICPAKFISASLLKRHLKNHPSGWQKMDVEQSSHGTDTNGKAAKGLATKDNDMVGYTPNEKGNSNVVYECTECIETFSCLEMFLQHQTSHGKENNV